jgi:N6-adenosine-specific RNA methylase IME4
MMFEHLPDYGNYKVCYADPPWAFKTYSDKGQEKAPEAHYSTMSLDDIKAMPVYDMMDKDAVLLMWVVNPLLPQAFEVITSWGFTYKTLGFSWAKQNKKSEGFFTGLGYYTRANIELCLLATKGKPLKRKSRGVRQLCVSPLREHSRKPDEIGDRIEALFDGPYVELFARTARPGWSAWGNQVGMFALPTDNAEAGAADDNAGDADENSDDNI